MVVLYTYSQLLTPTWFSYFCIAIDPDANTNSLETMKEFERSLFGDPPSNSLRL